MLSTETVRRWHERVTWATILATLWFVLYTSAMFDPRGPPDGNVIGYLFSSQHLSQPVGWLFLLSLLVILGGLSFRVYEGLAGY